MKRLAFLAVVLVAAGCGTKIVTVTNSVTTTPAAPATCRGSDLTASFDQLVGSAGAGNISYVLKLTNTSAKACVLRLVGLQLLDANGGEVSTHASPATTLTHLAPGASVKDEARFSPDVAGVGDNQTGACEPVANTLRVEVGSGTVDAPIKPPTSVCEQGSMQFRAG